MQNTAQRSSAALTHQMSPIAEQFARRWNFHHAVGALDGNHIAITCPKQAGSNYYNYKQFHSIIFVTLVDAEYKFSWVDVGSMGSTGDANVFNHSELRSCIDDDTIGFPAAEPLAQDDQDMPYFIVGDDAFALRTWMMKPYSKRHLTDPERIFQLPTLQGAENSGERLLGSLAHRFQCMLTTLKQRPKTVTSIVLACVCLHNMIILTNPRQQNVEVDREDEDHNIIPGTWRNDLVRLLPVCGQFRQGRETEVAKKQRDYLKAYYWSPVGYVPW